MICVASVAPLRKHSHNPDEPEAKSAFEKVPKNDVAFNLQNLSSAATRSRNEVPEVMLENPVDFVIARDHCRYRIPVHRVENLLKKRRPCRRPAFYQTKIFGNAAV